MDHFILPVLLTSFLLLPLSLLAQSSQIFVEGSVFCDPCFSNALSEFAYFMSGADVQIQCKLKANPPRTTEIITFSVNRTTNRNGIFRLEIPHLDGIDCVDGPPIQFSCQAILLRSSSSACNVPGSRSATYQLSIKSKQSNQCVYGFPGLSFRPVKRNETLCGAKTEDSKLYIPRISPQPRFPFLRPPPFWFPRPRRPSFRFPLPQTPLWNPPPPPPPPPYYRFPAPQRPNPPIPVLVWPPPPPVFRFEDPRTWFATNPYKSPSSPAPPSPVLNLMDPRSWTPPAGALDNKKP